MEEVNHVYLSFIIKYNTKMIFNVSGIKKVNNGSRNQSLTREKTHLDLGIKYNN
jgi:hypothetical protein